MAGLVGKYAAKKVLGKQMDKYRDKDVVPYVKNSLSLKKRCTRSACFLGESKHSSRRFQDRRLSYCIFYVWRMLQLPMQTCASVAKLCKIAGNITNMVAFRTRTTKWSQRTRGSQMAR